MAYTGNLHQSTTEQINQLSVMQLAQAGYFRAIAQWINVYLIPQGIYTQVSAATRPGYLAILVELQRMPDRDRLIRFICYRLAKLNSSVIQGAWISVRYRNTSGSLWETSVRLLAPSHSSSRQSASPQRTQVIKAAKPVPRVKKKTPPVLVAKPPALTPHKTTSPTTSKKYQPPYSGKRLNPQLRLLATTAVAAFLVGCTMKALTLYLSTMPAGFLQSHQGGSELATIQTALGNIPVTQMGNGKIPSDPAVTLSFGSDEAVKTAAAQPAASPEQKPAIAPSDYRADVTLTSLDSPPLPTTSASTAPPHPISIQTLKAEGVDVVNLASDDLLQEGTAELTRVLYQLEQAGIHPVGAGRNQQDARRPEIIDVKGQRIAYLGYSDSDTYAAGAKQAGINPGLDAQVAADIQAIRNQVDWVIVNYHWNQDLTEYPTAQQTSLARFAIDQGADLVVGHHPSVLQGAEIYKGRAIAYSLGNFIFADSTPIEENYDTAVLKVSLRPHQMRLEFLPVQVRRSKPQLVTNEKAAEILERLHQTSEQFETPMQSPIVLESRSHTPIPVATPEISPSQPAVDLPAAPIPERSPAPTNTLTLPKEASPSQQVLPSAAPQPTSPPLSAPVQEPPSGELGVDSQKHTTPFAPSNSFITYPDSPSGDSFIRYPDGANEKGKPIPSFQPDATRSDAGEQQHSSLPPTLPSASASVTKQTAPSLKLANFRLADANGSAATIAIPETGDATAAP